MSLKREFIRNTLLPVFLSAWKKASQEEQDKAIRYLVFTIAIRNSHDDNLSWVSQLANRKDLTYTPE